MSHSTATQLITIIVIGQPAAHRCGKNLVASFVASFVESTGHVNPALTNQQPETSTQRQNTRTRIWFAQQRTPDTLHRKPYSSRAFLSRAIRSQQQPNCKTLPHISTDRHCPNTINHAQKINATPASKHQCAHPTKHRHTEPMGPLYVTGFK